MRDLILELVPHAPQMGLYLHPDLPPDKLRNALNDYAKAVAPEDVVALYDATLLGNAKDGAVFTSEGFVFQNNDLEPAQSVRYTDLIHVDSRKRLLGGRKVHVDVNRGRATVTLTMDFSGKPAAAEYVVRFLQEALQRTAAAEMDRPARSTQKTSSGSDVAEIRQALDKLLSSEKLTGEDYREIMALVKDL